MEKGTKKFLALVSFASLASSVGATSSVYAADVPTTPQQNSTGSNNNTGNPTGSNNKTGNPTGSNNETGNSTGSNNETGNPTGSNNETGNSTGSNNETGNSTAGQSDAEALRLAEEAKKRGENKAKGKVDDEYDVFYALDPSKNFDAAYSSYFDKVKIGDKDFYKKKGDLNEDVLLEANKALADFTPYYFGKEINKGVTVNGFDKLTTAGIAGGAAVVAAGTALAIREYMAGNSDAEDSE